MSNPNLDKDGKQQPAVYMDGAEIVVRASSSGKCIQQLCRFLAGYEASKMFPGMRKAAEKGNELEPIVIAELVRRGLPVVNTQAKASWQVIPGLRIQGSLDGTTTNAVVEVKTRNQERYDLTLELGPEGIPSMLIQGFTYATALGYPQVIFATALRQACYEKVAKSVVLHYREVPPYFKEWMQIRMQKLLDFSKEEMPDCEGEDLKCPFRGCPYGSGIVRNKERRGQFGRRITAFRRTSSSSPET